MSDAVQILIAEHRLVERVLLAMDACVVALRDGQAIDHGWLTSVARFHVLHTDGTHHAKEEGGLFRALTAKGLSGNRGPIATLLNEHNVGRSLVQHLSRAAAQCAAREPEAIEVWASTATAFGRLLRSHIKNEERVLFPLARQMLSDEEQRRVVADYEQVPPSGEPMETLADQLLEGALTWWPAALPRPA